MTKYGEAVKYVGKTFLLGKGQTLEDYIAYMKEPGNKGMNFHYIYAHVCARNKLQLSPKQMFTTQKNSTTVAMILFKFWTVTWS